MGVFPRLFTFYGWGQPLLLARIFADSKNRMNSTHRNALGAYAEGFFVLLRAIIHA